MRSKEFIWLFPMKETKSNISLYSDITRQKLYKKINNYYSNFKNIMNY